MSAITDKHAKRQAEELQRMEEVDFVTKLKNDGNSWAQPLFDEAARRIESYNRVVRDTTQELHTTLVLFGRYMDHIGQCHGRLFLREIPADKHGGMIEDRSSVVFSENELKTLNAIADMFWTKPLSSPTEPERTVPRYSGDDGADNLDGHWPT